MAPVSQGLEPPRKPVRFTFQKADALGRNGCIQRDHLHQRLAGLGNHERLALHGLIDQLGKLGLGFVDIDGFHS
jgi:hypothetical protein